MGAYRALTPIDGEPHSVRMELLDGGASSGAWRPVPLLCFAHLTDLQLADVQSPVRFEFFNREFADPRFEELIPVQRPQEALTSHAVDAMVRAVNGVRTGPVAGGPVELVVTTGDSVDNAQWNELQAILDLFDGGVVRLESGAPGYEGVQAPSWPDDIFWRPDGGGDLFRAGFGFPDHPGLLEAAVAAFRAGGLDAPWLACNGNHEALVQGLGRVTPEIADAFVASSKPSRLREDVSRDEALELFTSAVHVFMTGAPLTVSADPDRRALSRRSFVEAHFRDGGRPRGHGFTETNRLRGTAHYVHDAGPVRFVGLDTACPHGGSDGAVDSDQAAWLAEALAEVHSSYRGVDGSDIRTSNDDRLVVLLSHHGLDEMTNRRGRPDGLRVVPADELRALVHRFPNVVAWVNGHTHTNGVQVRRDPLDPGRGFWEITTCSLMDWPCQARLIELVDDGDGTMSIVCTMLDHDGVVASSGVRADDGWSGTLLAGLHRELAANAPFGGPESPLAGSPADRNVVLRMRPPFPVQRVHT
jgi:metallophosphoesterase (TIGR03767 family)